MAHFSAATPEEYRVNATDLLNDETRSTARGGPTVRIGKLCATDTRGFGVEPDYGPLRDPMVIYAF